MLIPTHEWCDFKLKDDQIRSDGTVTIVANNKMNIPAWILYSLQSEDFVLNYGDGNVRDEKK